MIGKLIFNNRKGRQLTFSVSGSIIGLVIMLLSIQLYLDITTILHSPTIAGTDFLVINKEVNMLVDGNFNQSELESIKEQEFVIDVAPVYSNNFQSLVVADVGPWPLVLVAGQWPLVLVAGTWPLEIMQRTQDAACLHHLGMGVSTNAGLTAGTRHRRRCRRL